MRFNGEHSRKQEKRQGYFFPLHCLFRARCARQANQKINALAAADYCIIPVQAHFLASEGIPDVLEMVKNVQNRFNPDLKIAGILLTMQGVRSKVNAPLIKAPGKAGGPHRK